MLPLFFSVVVLIVSVIVVVLTSYVSRDTVNVDVLSDGANSFLVSVLLH